MAGGLQIVIYTVGSLPQIAVGAPAPRLIEHERAAVTI
jgi:hypothetical protein